MGISHIRKANIGIQLITLTNNGEPDWSIILTAGKNTIKNHSGTFNDIYWTEYHSVKNGDGTGLIELPDYLEEKLSFDRKE